MIRSGWYHANHRKGLRIQQYFAPQNVRCRAKLISPNAVAQNNFVSAPRPLFRKIKFAPRRWMNAKHPKISRADSKSRQPQGITAGAGKLQIGARIHGKALERPVPRAKIQEIPGIQGKFRILQASVKHARNALRMGIRQRLQQHTIDHAKNRAVRSDAQRKRQNNYHGKCRTLAELAPRVMQSCKKFSAYCVRRMSRHSSRTWLTPPNMREAASRASRSFIPAARFSSVWRSKW